jgi:hypothetical protein
MQKFSRSTTAATLGIPLPECSVCGEDRFVVGKICSGNQLNISCKGCNIGTARIPLPSDLVSLNSLTKKGVYFLLPYPLPNPLLNWLKINWSPTTSQSAKQPAKQENASSTQSKDKDYGKVRTFNILNIYLLLCLLDSFATSVKMWGPW